MAPPALTDPDDTQSLIREAISAATRSPTAPPSKALRHRLYDDQTDEPSPYDLTAIQAAVDEVSLAAISAKPSLKPSPTPAPITPTDAPEAPPAPARRLRLALFAWESLHSIAVGGVAPHLTELAAGLERKGHEVHVYVRSGAGQKAYDMIDGVHVHRVTFKLSSDMVQEVTNMCNAMVHFMLETERFMDARFDCVHAHDWLAAPALINVKAHHNRPCVLTIHSTEYGRCGNNTYGGQSSRIRRVEQDAIAAADRVICVSGVLCDEVKAHYSVDWAKLRCVYNGINCLRYDGALWDPAQVRQKYGVGPMDPMVLTVGRMVIQKGIDILIEAAPAVLAARPDVKFIIVGDGYMKSELERRANELGVASSIRFTGSMSGQALVDLYKATDLVAIPSRNEPFGIVCLEAWASSKPIVVTKACGPRDFVWHDNDGFLVDVNPTGIAWGITAAFSNFKHMKYMGERGRVKAAFQFSWNRIASDTEEVYGKLLESWGM